MLKQPNKIPANLQILLIPINRLLLLLLVVLYYGKHGRCHIAGSFTCSPSHHKILYWQLRPIEAGCCATESRSFRPQRRTIVIRQHTPISPLSRARARTRSRVLRSISRAYGRDVRQCTRTYENVYVEDTMYKNT